MKPAQASAIFARMDPYLAAGFLGMMRPESAAAVMSGLDPAAAYAISALIAGRHMDVPTQ
jgi:flagellar motility protein MotE (MotC chaperone)